MFDKNKEKIAKNIRMIRESKNLSQSIVAQKAGISRVALSNIENCKYQTYNTGTLMLIASALEVKLVDLFRVVPTITKYKWN